MSRRMQVIGAHSADFVWRAGGAIAKAVAAGGVAEVIALSYGERGESGELWKEEGQTLDNVKRVRHAEAEAAAGAPRRVVPLHWTSATTRCRSTATRCSRSPRRSARSRPTCSITHTDTDPFNPDHPVAHAAVDRARGLAAGAGVSSAFATIRPPQLFLFEPHQPELCNFTPTVLVDITAVWEQKRAAMAEMKAQQYLQTYYAPARRAARQPRAARLGRAVGAVRRGVPARRAPGGGASCEHRRRAGAAGQRDGLRGGRAARACVDVELRPVVPGARAAGRRARCAAARTTTSWSTPRWRELQPGEVLVLTMPEPAPVALFGDLLATQAQARGAAAILVDAAVRDIEELAELGLPIVDALGPLARRDEGRSSASSTCR